MQFRVVKIKTAENTYEYLITNLPHSFTMDDIKECYHWRWALKFLSVILSMQMDFCTSTVKNPNS